MLLIESFYYYFLNFSAKKYHLLKKEKALIVVSENGIDSGGAGVELKKLGIEKVYLLKHGLLSWQEESLPLVK